MGVIILKRESETKINHPTCDTEALIDSPFSIQPGKSEINQSDISKRKISTNGGSIRGRIWGDIVWGER